MINSLYPQFQYWSSTGSVYIISDTHFEDSDCKYMDPDWITPQEHIDIIRRQVRRPDTLVHLGDVGNGEWLIQVPAAHKILITGNHDVLSKVSKYFDEVYTGPLFIADRILLSHEPIYGLENFCCNIHGHNHAAGNVLYMSSNTNHINLASNVYNYQVFNLGKEIKNGLLSQIKNYHRCTINEATFRKEKKEELYKLCIEPVETINAYYSNKIDTPEACKYCPNHPSNGGSGICNCTLGLPKITC